MSASDSSSFAMASAYATIVLAYGLTTLSMFLKKRYALSSDVVDNNVAIIALQFLTRYTNSVLIDDPIVTLYFDYLVFNLRFTSKSAIMLYAVNSN